VQIRPKQKLALRAEHGGLPFDFRVEVLTPKLNRLKPNSANSARRSALTVRGSTSMEYSAGSQSEAALEHGHQLTQPIIRQERGGPAAQMQLANHLPHTALGCMQVDFAAQVPQIDISTIMVFGNDLVASAVVA
jgi:hypothetical protein